MSRLSVYAVIAVILIGIGAFIWDLNSGPAAVTMPELSSFAAKGKKVFDSNCAACHGVNGVGTNTGPPLVHDIYNPGHHDDRSFYRAVKSGVPQHHWRFGNMQPMPKVTESQIGAIVRYVRELQLANGITYRPHRM